MMIKVTDFLESLLLQDSYDYILSIVDTHNNYAKHFSDHKQNRYIIHFDDYEDPLIMEAPTRKNIENIFTWAKGLPGNPSLLVHCLAGISRSTAVAIGLEILINRKSIKSAYEDIEKQRPLLWPNRLVIGYVDDILDLNGELLRYDNKFKENDAFKLVH